MTINAGFVINVRKSKTKQNNAFVSLRDHKKHPAQAGFFI
jgi:hypothetical protein